MKTVSLFVKTHKRITCFVIVMFVLIFIAIKMPGLKDYSILYNADVLNVYAANDALIAVINNPVYMLDSQIDGAMPLHLTELSRLGIPRICMAELYRLEFVENGKIISIIRILTPQTQWANNKITQSDSKYEWKVLNGSYVIMTENTKYFSFGSTFFENLSSLLIKEQNNAK